MQKNITKTETVAEFIARGGSVKKLPAKPASKKYTKVVRQACLADEIDLDHLPMALKIKYGIR